MAVENSNHSKIRKRTYYLGTGLVALGLLLLLAAALPVVEHLGNLPAIRAELHSIVLKGFSGAVLILIGFIAITIGSIETVGSGVNVRSESSLGEEGEAEPIGEDRISLSLNTCQPDNRYAEISQSAAADHGVCCLQCTAINPSNAKYCNQCGNEIPFRRRNSQTLFHSATA